MTQKSFWSFIACAHVALDLELAGHVGGRRVLLAATIRSKVSSEVEIVLSAVARRPRRRVTPAVVDVDRPRPGAVDRRRGSVLFIPAVFAGRPSPAGSSKNSRAPGHSVSFLSVSPASYARRRGELAARRAGAAVGQAAARARAPSTGAAAQTSSAVAQVDRVGDRAERDGGDPAEADREPDREARRHPDVARQVLLAHHHRHAERPDHAARRRARARSRRATPPTSMNTRISGGAASRLAEQHRPQRRSGRRAGRQRASRARRRAASARAGGCRAPSSGRARPPTAGRR